MLGMVAKIMLRWVTFLTIYIQYTLPLWSTQSYESIQVNHVFLTNCVGTHGLALKVMRCGLACTTLISRLSAHPFKYASWLSAQKNWQKPWFIIYCLNMLCKVICHECMNFSHLIFIVNVVMFCWNVSNDCHISSWICRASVWTLEQNNWLSMSRTVKLQSLWSR